MRIHRNSKSRLLEIGGYSVEVTRKRIKNLHLTIVSADGRLRVSAPLFVSDAAILAFVLSKQAWIAKHLDAFRDRQSSLLLEYISGETHYLAGKSYLLNHIPDSPFNRIRIRDEATLDLWTKPGTDQPKRRDLFEEWHRACLKARLEPLLAVWQQRLGVQAQEWAVKRMKTKWGTCNTRSRKVWFNLELAQRDDRCLEYIVVHELAHLLEAGHGPAFKAHMDSYLPDWRERRKELNIPPGLA